MSRFRRPTGDGGVFAILMALLIVILCVVAAIVIDIGGLRYDRRSDRLAADAAAAAGAAFLNPADANSPADACRNAFEYAADNLEGPGTMSRGACTGLNGPCTALSTSRTVTGTKGRYVVTVTYPVPDNSPMMVPDVAPDRSAAVNVQTVDTSYDGLSCQRFAVTVQANRTFGLANAAKIRRSATAVHSVARTDVVGHNDVLAPLVVLDPTHCNTLFTSGQGDIRVVNNGTSPGVIAVDSDGTQDGNPLRCDSPNQYVLDSQGTTNGRILAYPGSGGEPAAIYDYALLGSRADRAFDPGDVVSGCDATSPVRASSGKVCPRPTALGARITRTPWDNRYGAYIATLRTAYGGTSAPASATTVYAAGDPLCGNSAPAKIFPANQVYYFNCTPNVKNVAWRFLPGSTVVFEGNVNVATGGCIYFNATDTTTDATLPCPTGTITEPGTDMVVYMQRGHTSGSDKGLLSKDSNGSLIAARTAIVQSGDDSTPDIGHFTLNGGPGRIYWTSLKDTATPYRANLAYWSEGRSYAKDGEAAGITGPHILGGQSNVTLTGVMFMPNAQVTFNGQTGDAQFAAQFVAYRLTNSGQSNVNLLPDPGNMVSIPIVGVHLIR